MSPSKTQKCMLLFMSCRRAFLWNVTPVMYIKWIAITRLSVTVWKEFRRTYNLFMMSSIDQFANFFNDYTLYSPLNRNFPSILRQKGTLCIFLEVVASFGSSRNRLRFDYPTQSTRIHPRQLLWKLYFVVSWIGINSIRSSEGTWHCFIFSLCSMLSRSFMTRATQIESISFRTEGEVTCVRR